MKIKFAVFCIDYSIAHNFHEELLERLPILANKISTNKEDWNVSNKIIEPQRWKLDVQSDAVEICSPQSRCFLRIQIRNARNSAELSPVTE